MDWITPLKTAERFRGTASTASELAGTVTVTKPTGSLVAVWPKLGAALSKMAAPRRVSLRFMDVVWIGFDELIPEFEKLLQDFGISVDLFLRDGIVRDRRGGEMFGEGLTRAQKVGEDRND
jgi:hypothetical protein